MLKKIIALSTMLLSVLLVLASVGKVTMRGIVNYETTFYQTFFMSEKAYYNLIESGKSSFILFVIIFVIGCFILFIPNFLLFNQHKFRSITLMAINTIGLISVFLSYQNYQYMFMMTIICVLYTCNIIIQFTKTVLDRTNLFVIIFTVFLLAINCYYLFEHLSKFQLWMNWSISSKLLKEMIHISRINMVCFALWFIPYGILLVREINGSKDKKVQSI